MTAAGTKYKTSFLHLGFRPFFLGAGIAAVLLVLAWLLIYQFSWTIGLNGIPATYWHAHEMIFGYALAIIAGFLLTATKNWTNIQTLHGFKLLALTSCWAAARIVPFTGNLIPVGIMALADILFLLILLIHVSLLIIKTRQYRQLIILLLVIMLLLSNAVFYTGLLRNNTSFMQKGIYTGLYLILSMVIVMGGRVIPFFIERGVGIPVVLKKMAWLDAACILLFVLFWITEVYTPFRNLAAVFAGVSFILNAWRLYNWHTPGLWHKPLLWVLYMAYAMLVSGLLLRAAAGMLNLSPYLAIHAFGYGGIGVITLGMMCRVAWGHTGREIAAPPRALPLMFIPLLLGAFVRSIVPAFFPAQYAFWIGISQVLWILSFAVFLYVYTPVLVLPRVDGKSG